MDDLEFGATKDTTIKVSRETFRQGFVIVTIIAFILLFIVVGVIIWYSWSQVNPTIETTIGETTQKNMNPMIITQEQCLTIPNASWSVSGCQCQIPYTGDFCRAQLVRGMTEIGPVADKEVISKISGTTSETLDLCTIRCFNDEFCTGIIHDDVSCKLLRGPIARHTKRKISTARLYVKEPINLTYKNKVFLGLSGRFPIEFWNAPDSENFVQLKINKLQQLTFSPTYVKNNGYVGIFSQQSFTKDEIPQMINDGSALVIKDDGLISIPWIPYVMYVNE